MTKRRGDTLIEIMFSVAIFGAVAISVISLMNRGLGINQNSLETTMARQEIDAQIEALRFIHNAYVNEAKLSDDSVYYPIWHSLIANAYDATDGTNGILLEDNDFYTRTVENNKSCDEIYANGFPAKSFIVNPRKLDSDTVSANTIIYYDNPGLVEIRHASVYPRLLYGVNTESLSDVATDQTGITNVYDDSTLSASEGIWVTAIKSASSIKTEDGATQPDFYDFYVTACWGRPDGNGSTTIDSILRLYNTDQIVFDSRPRFSGFVLNYDANGGTGAPEPEKFDDLTYPNHTFAVSSTVPTNGSLRFIGWSLDPNATHGTYGHGGSLSPSISVNKLRTTLYAIWETPWVYSLTYDLDGGSLPSSTTINERYPTTGATYDETHNFTVTSTVPTKSNYKFIGWYDSGTKRDAGTVITLTKSSLTKTLKAKWQQYTHTLAYSGGTGATDVPSNQTCVSDGTSCTITLSSTTPKKTDYIFKGWEYNGSTYQAGASFTHSSPGSTITLTAKWEHVSYTFTITYSAKSGDTGVTGLPSNTTCTNTSKSCAMTISSSTPSRPNYDFAGWAITNTGNAVYQPGGSYSHTVPNGSVTLYAVWTLKAHTCYKEYRLQNADGTYPSTYTADGSSDIKSGQTCSYQKSVDYYVTQSDSKTMSSDDITISLSLPRTTYRLTLENGAFTAPATGDYASKSDYKDFRWGESVAIYSERFSYVTRYYAYLGTWQEHAAGSGSSFTSGRSSATDASPTSSVGSWYGSAVYVMGKGASRLYFDATRLNSAHQLTASQCREFASGTPFTVLGTTFLYIGDACWATNTTSDYYIYYYHNYYKMLATQHTLNWNGAKTYCLSPWELPSSTDALRVINNYSSGSAFTQNTEASTEWWLADTHEREVRLLNYSGGSNLDITTINAYKYDSTTISTYRAKVRCIRRN